MTKSTLNVAISPVVLFDYSIVSLMVSAVSENEEPAPRKSNIEISMMDAKPASQEIEGDLRDVYTARMNVEVEPAKESNFYKCKVAISGLFAVMDDGMAEDDIVKDISMKGAKELYDIARVILSQNTASGVFGSLFLPSIDVRLKSSEDLVYEVC